jgi:hypothetical protein
MPQKKSPSEGKPSDKGVARRGGGSAPARIGSARGDYRSVIRSRGDSAIPENR